MKLKEKKIVEALPASPGASFDFKGVYTDQEGESTNVTVFDTEYFITNVIQLYRNRKVMIDEDQQNYLASLFRIWKSSREQLYIKQAYAYTLKYNPISNYDMVENMIDDETVHEYLSTKDRSFDEYKETEETTPYTKEETEITPFTKETTTHITPKLTEETTPFTKEETTTSPEDTTTTATSAFNASGFTDTDKTTRGGKITESLEKTGTEKVETYYPQNENPADEITKEGKEKHTLTKTGTEKHEKSFEGTVTDAHNGSDTDTRNYTLTRAGNIGVQTVSEMLQKEYDNLMQDLAHRALYEFIDRYTWYSEEVD